MECKIYLILGICFVGGTNMGLAILKDTVKPNNQKVLETYTNSKNVNAASEEQFIAANSTSQGLTPAFVVNLSNEGSHVQKSIINHASNARMSLDGRGL